MKKTSRDLGNNDVKLGDCVNADNNRIGQNALKHITVTQQERNHVSIKYKQVKSAWKSRDFLGVSNGTVLKVKAGLLPPDELTEYLFRTAGTNEENTAEILVRLECVKVIESVETWNANNVNNLPLEELTPFTHFVQSITFGGELVASVKVTNCIGSLGESTESLADSEGDVVNLSYDKLYGDINRLKADNSVVTIQCYATGCDIGQPPESVSQLLSLLHEFSFKVHGKGAPLKCESQALSSLPGFEDKLPVCTEKKPICASPQIQEFENEFREVCKAEDILQQTLQDSEGRVEDRQKFDGEVETFRTKLMKIKKVYTDCIGSDMDRCSSEEELNGLLRTVRQKYDEVKPREKSNDFATAIAVTLKPKFKPENYAILTAEQWKKYSKYGEQLLREMDTQEKEKVDKFLERVTLQKNTLKHLKETGAEPLKLPELRVVLLGKTGAGKSATGNTLLGEKIFDENFNHLARMVRKDAKFQIGDRIIHVVDTPGLFDNVMNEEDVMLLIAKTLLTFPHGVHVFIYVLNAADPRFTEEDKKTLEKIKSMFGVALMKHTITVYTRGEAKFEREDYTLKDHLGELDPKRSPEDPLAVLLKEDVEERVIAVNNTCKSKYEEEKIREALIELIDVVQTKNTGKLYGAKYFETGEKKLKERDKEEEEARDKILGEELTRWKDALRGAKQESGCLLDKYWNKIQLDILEKERRSDFKNIITAIISNFQILTKGLSTLLQVIEMDVDDSLDALLNGMNDAAGCKLNRLEAEVDKQEEGVKSGCFFRKKANAAMQKICEERKEIERIKGKLNSSEEMMAAKRMKLIKLLSEKGANRQEYTLVIGYATQVSSLIAENYLGPMSLKQLEKEVDNNYAKVTTEVTNKLYDYLKKMKKQLEVMLNYKKEDAGAAYSPIQTIVQEAVYTVAPAVMTRLQDKDQMTRLQDEDEKEPYKNLRLEWRKRYMKVIEEEVLTDELKMIYGRQLAVCIAEESADIQKNVKVTGCSELDKLYYKRIEANLKTALANAKHGKETWDFLSKRRNVGKLVEKAVIESVTAAADMNARSRKKYRFSESLKALDEASSIEAIEVAKTCTIQAAEFLADRQLNYSRLQEFQKGYEIEVKNGGENTDKTITKEFGIFQKFDVPDVKKKIAKQFAKLYVSNLMLELEDDFEKKENIKIENENLKRRWKKLETDYETKITDLTTYLTSMIRDQAREYAKKRNKDELKEMKNDDFKGASKTLSTEVKKVLSKEFKKYFEQQKIENNVKTYVELNYEILMNLAKEVKCFPSEVTVVEQKRGEIKIPDVRVGDKILTASPEGTRIYEEVFMFAHADASAVDTYLELYSEAGPSVPLSKNHLLHVGCQGKLKAAKDVIEGDSIFVMSDGKLQKTNVTEIVEVTKRGAYCPYTTGGSLVVNDILASCYTDVVSHQVAHVMLFPVRLLYFLLPSRVFNWLFWYDEKVGMPKLLLKVKNFYQWMWGNQRA